MLAAHAPAVVGAWRSVVGSEFEVERLGGCIALTLSMLFFALKVRDVAFLRLRTDRRSLAALCIIVALLHVNVVRPHGDPTMVPQCAVLVATTWLVGHLPMTRRALRVLRTRIAKTPGHRPPVTPLTDTVRLDMFRPHCRVLAFRLFCLRAPPA